MPSPYHLRLADSAELLPKLRAGSIDALVTDPPAGISFMAKEWDGDHGGRREWIAAIAPIFRECLRALRAGAWGLVWAIPRTSHWTATALEEAGFDIRDVGVHLFGQGFPKAKACLKPAAEHWILVRKGGGSELQIDACRLAYLSDADKATATPAGRCTSNAASGRTPEAGRALARRDFARPEQRGRWPANVSLDEEAAAELDRQSGELTSGTGAITKRSAAGYRPLALGGDNRPAGATHVEYGDTGGASRFFYVAKASRKERGPGNDHPTVKPIALMEWLCRLVTPPGGIILDPFLGSGTTGIAALRAGFRFIGIERDPHYFEIAERRIAQAVKESPCADESSGPSPSPS